MRYMRDYNFFSPYIESKRSYKEDKRIFLIAIGTILFLSAIFYYGLNAYNIQQMRKDIASVDSYLSTEKTIQGVKKYEETKQKISVLKNYQQIINEINKNVDSGDRINTNLLSKLSSTLPLNVELNVLSITSEGLQLQGKSSSRAAIAEYIYNLKDTKAFDSVYVASINEENETGQNYIFTLICKLGVSSNNEAE